MCLCVQQRCALLRVSDCPRHDKYFAIFWRANHALHTHTHTRARARERTHTHILLPPTPHRRFEYHKQEHLVMGYYSAASPNNTKVESGWLIDWRTDTTNDAIQGLTPATHSLTHRRVLVLRNMIVLNHSQAFRFFVLWTHLLVAPSPIPGCTDPYCFLHLL
jgi:hypothetical protein